MQNLSEKKIAWIAVTGTIASGKSSVCRMLKEKGYPVYDCDAINRELMQPGNLGYIRVVETFGQTILNKDKQIDSNQLAQVIFSQPQAKQRLEQIMHPLILDRLNQEKKKNQTITFVEVPLLFEVGWEKQFDESWCVVIEDELVIERAIQRGMKKEDVVRRLHHQMPSSIKRQKATVVIENNADKHKLNQQIEKEIERLWQRNKNIKLNELNT